MINEATYPSTLRFIANHPEERMFGTASSLDWSVFQTCRIPNDKPIIFLKVTVRSASEFATPVRMTREEIGG